MYFDNFIFSFNFYKLKSLPFCFLNNLTNFAPKFINTRKIIHAVIDPAIDA